MPNADKTHIIAVLDRSGSMSSIRSDVIGGYNAFIESQRALDGECSVTLSIFDNIVNVVYEDQPLDQVPELTDQVFVPRGSTALLDALGGALASYKDVFLKLEEEDRPGLVVVLVFTDGLENASHEWSKKATRELLEEMQEGHSWQAVFLGADMDAFGEGGGLGINAASTARASAQNSKQALHATSAYVGRMRTAAQAGALEAEASRGFTSDERRLMVDND